MLEVKIRNLGNNGNRNSRFNDEFLDQHNFEQIYRGSFKMMFVAAYRILCNVEDAEDAVQKAFLKLAKYYSKFRGEAKISTYLHRIVVNESLMMLRPKERRVCKVSLEQECLNGDRLISEIPGPSVDCRYKEDGIAIEKAVSHLPTGYRRVWILYDYLGCRHQEVAKTLNCSIGNSKSQLRKALKKLRRVLNPEQNSKQRLRQKKNSSNGFDFHRELESLHQQFLLAHLI